MNLISTDWVTALNKVRNRDFQASEYSMDRPTLLSDEDLFWKTSGGLNYSGLSDKRVDSLISSLSKEASKKKRLLLCKKLDLLIAELRPLTFGWDQAYLRIAYKKGLDTTKNPVYAYSNWRNAFHHWSPLTTIPWYPFPYSVFFLLWFHSSLFAEFRFLCSWGKRKFSRDANQLWPKKYVWKKSKSSLDLLRSIWL